jgi:hypothetical protein
MANEEVRRKLQELAGKVQGTITTHSQDKRLDEALSGKLVRSKDDLKIVIAEGLEKRASDVVFASDDSDRLADEIIGLLKGK